VRGRKRLRRRGRHAGGSGWYGVCEREFEKLCLFQGGMRVVGDGRAGRAGLFGQYVDRRRVLALHGRSCGGGMAVRLVRE
jgi:hypothetical protein